MAKTDAAIAKRIRHAPPLIDLLVRSTLLGGAIGVAFVSLFLLMNIAGLRDLISQASEPYLALALLYLFNVFTFSSVTIGAAIMRLPWDRE